MSTILSRSDDRTLRSSLGKGGLWNKKGRKRLFLAALAVGVVGGGCKIIGWPTAPSPMMEGSVAMNDVSKAQRPKIACPATPEALSDELKHINQAFGGHAGIAVRRVGCDWIAGDRGEVLFPQQSVSKLWVTLAVLEQIDRGQHNLDDPVKTGIQDLVVFHQPMRQQVLEKGEDIRPVRTLVHAAITQSDNLANDRLLWLAGGPDAIRRTLADKNIEAVRFGPGERLLQSRIAGLEWRQEMSIGRTFYDVRNTLPMSTRQASLRAYLDDPMDGAAPASIADALARLVDGSLLKPETTDFFLKTLEQTHSGPRRLKAGAPEGWKVLHKTGTGQDLAGTSTGYNDVGLLQAPDGAWYSVAVMIGETKRPIPDRMDMMQSVSAAIARFHDGIVG